MYSKHVTILCDGEDCYMNTGYLEASTATKAREAIKAQGWTHRNGKDYCPECSGNTEED